MAKKDGEELQFDIAGEKQKALQAAMDKIEKNYGKGAVMKMGTGGLRGIDIIPSGSIGLNAALGVGGYPRGRIIEIYGPESSGKRHWLFMPLPRRRGWEVWRHSLMPNMLLTVRMQWALE